MMSFERVVVLIYASVAVEIAAGVAQLGQRRWDEVPVRNGSQVRILPSAPLLPTSSQSRLSWTACSHGR